MQLKYKFQYQTFFRSKKLKIHYFDSNYIKDLSWYLKQFPLARADQLLYEKTPR